HFKANIVETSRVPEQHEVTAERLLVVDIVFLGIDQGTQSGLRNAACPPEVNRFDSIVVRNLLLRLIRSLLLRSLKGVRRGRGLRNRFEGVLLILWSLLGLLGHQGYSSHKRAQ